MRNDLPISQDKKFKYSITFQSFDEESLEIGETDDKGYEVEETTDTIGEILHEANTTYGIYMPVSFGYWESTEPESDTDYFEKGIRKFYALHISNEDGTDISQEENDFITFLLSDGRYEINKFRDYAVGGIVLGTVALGVGALIAYFYFKGKKTKKEVVGKGTVNNRAKSVTHIIRGKERKFPIKDAWKREHSLENKSEKYEVPKADRKPIKYEMGGDASEYYHEVEYGEGGVARAKDVIMNKIGYNEDVADYFVSKSEKFAIWLADSILKKELNEKNYNKKQWLDSNYSSWRIINANYGGGIREILDWLQHPVTPKQDLRKLTFDEALEKAREWHNELQVLGGDIDFTEPETNQILKKYSVNADGIEYYWVFIPSNYCDLESSRMGHCGRTGYGNNLISLRSVKPYGKGHTISDSHVTIAYGINDGIFYQVKGKKNNKPAEKYFPYIFDLLKSMLNNDINKLNSEKIENINSEIEKINKGIENIGNELALIDTKSIEFKAKTDAIKFLVKEKGELEKSLEKIDLDFNFNGFGSEYGDSEDYGYEDMTKEQLRELYDLEPSIFNDAESILSIFDAGVINSDELKEIIDGNNDFDTFGNQMKLYDRGIISESPSTIFELNYSCDEVYRLLDIGRDYSDSLVEDILCGDVGELSDSWSYYYKNPSDLVGNLNKENEQAVIDEIVRITGYEKSEVEENGIEYYLNGEDENFPSDDFDNIIRVLASAQNSADEIDYYNYLYDQLKSSLEELGEVHSLNDEGVKMTIDLSNYMSNEEIAEGMDRYEFSDVADLFNEEIHNSYGGAIDRPKLRIDDRYSPYGSSEDFNQYVRDSDLESGYEKGGYLREKNTKNMKQMKMKFEEGGGVDSDRIIIRSGNKGKTEVVFDRPKNQKNELLSNEIFLEEKMKGKSVFLLVNDEIYDEYIQDSDEDEYAKGGGVGQFPPKGELTNKDNFLLKYEKKGGDYEFYIYKPETKKVGSYNQVKHICVNKDCPTKMSYNQFINYLYAELYLDDRKYVNGGRVTTNDGIIESFLTSERELKVGNLSTHYNQYDNQMLLRNYGTLIATRKGNDVEITNTKYSKTTTIITNKVRNMALNKRMNVKHVDKFADGGEAGDKYSLENYSDYDEFYNDVFDYIKSEEKLTEEETKDICITNESIIEAEFDGGSSPRFTGDVVLGYLSNERAYKNYAKGGQIKEEWKSYLKESRADALVKAGYSKNVAKNLSLESWDSLEKQVQNAFKNVLISEEIEYMKSMMESLYTYGGLDKENNYLAKYKLSLGNKLFNKTFNEYKKELEEGYDVDYGTYTDSEGLTYSSLRKKFADGGKVLASSSSKEGISKLIEQYLYGSTITLVQTDNDKIYEVHNKKGKTSFYVEFSRGKYKFIQPSMFADGGETSEWKIGDKFRVLKGIYGDYNSPRYANKEFEVINIRDGKYIDARTPKGTTETFDIKNIEKIKFAGGGEAVEKYNVVKVFRKSGRREILEKNLTLEEARRVVSRYPNSNTSMVVFMKMYAKGGQAGSFSYDYYEVYDESTGKSLMIYAIDQEDAESIAEELDFESFEDGDEYNPNEDEYAKGGGINDCIEYIKNSESIKNNGYYLHIDNLLNYVGANSVNIPKINSLCMITFNSGGQKNLKAVDTINSTILASEISKLLNIDIEIARIIVYEQTTYSKPFTMDMLKNIENKNIIVADRDKIVCDNLSNDTYAKGGLLGEDARLEYVTDAYASYDLRQQLRDKLGIETDSLGENYVISFAYTDYGGDFLDKVAIEYFQETYPENTLVEPTSWGGQNAYVFGEPAKEWIETTEDYPLGFEDIEDFYYEKQNEQEAEDFNYFLDEITDDYNFDREEAFDWLMENKGGYYGMTTQGLDFSYEDLTNELVLEGIIEPKEEDEDEYAEGGEVQDWMEQALDSLMEETGFDDLEITIVSDEGNEFIATDGDAEYRVFKTEDDAKETAIEQVREDLEENPEYFNKDFISNYIDGRDFFEEALDEMNLGYAEDIKSESDDIYANRLIQEMVENGILNEDDALSGNAEELADYYMQDFVNLMTEGQLDEGNDGLDYFISNFGEEYTMELVIDNNLIDVDEASQDAVDTDGIGHFLSSYDGETVYLSNDSVAYRVN